MDTRRGRYNSPGRDELHQRILAWKNANPDWQLHASKPDSPGYLNHIQQRREEIYQELAEFGITALHGELIQKHGLRPDPTRGGFAAYVESRAMAHVQEGRGIHLPFHQEMENCLAHIYKTIDSHVGPNLATNAITRIEDWFEENIRQPIARGIQRARR